MVDETDLSVVCACLMHKDDDDDGDGRGENYFERPWRKDYSYPANAREITDGQLLNIWVLFDKLKLICLAKKAEFSQEWIAGNKELHS